MTSLGRGIATAPFHLGVTLVYILANLQLLKMCNKWCLSLPQRPDKYQGKSSCCCQPLTKIMAKFYHNVKEDFAFKMVLILQHKWVEYFTGVIQNISLSEQLQWLKKELGVSNVYLTFFLLENLQHSKENNKFFMFLLDQRVGAVCISNILFTVEWIFSC